MSTSIFIRSYQKDFDWLGYCLASIRKFATGFEETVIVVPDDSYRRLKQFNLQGERIFSCPNSKDGYLHQQVTKLHADTYVQGDHVLYFDSDCVFTGPVTPETYTADGKPVLLATPYASLGTSVPWKPITEKALGFECPFETMRRFPILYPKDILLQVRSHLEEQHKCDTTSYIMSQPHRAFSEFNVLGSYALKFRPQDFTILNTDINPLPPETAIQNWSWGGISDELRTKLQSITT